MNPQNFRPIELPSTRTPSTRSIPTILKPCARMPSDLSPKPRKGSSKNFPALPIPPEIAPQPPPSFIPPTPTHAHALTSPLQNRLKDTTSTRKVRARRSRLPEKSLRTRPEKPVFTFRVQKQPKPPLSHIALTPWWR